MREKNSFFLSIFLKSKKSSFFDFFPKQGAFSKILIHATIAICKCFPTIPRSRPTDSVSGLQLEKTGFSAPGYAERKFIYMRKFIYIWSQAEGRAPTQTCFVWPLVVAQSSLGTCGGQLVFSSSFVEIVEENVFFLRKFEREAKMKIFQIFFLTESFLEKLDTRNDRHLQVLSNDTWLALSEYAPSDLGRKNWFDV